MRKSKSAACKDHLRVPTFIPTPVSCRRMRKYRLIPTCPFICLYYIRTRHYLQHAAIAELEAHDGTDLIILHAVCNIKDYMIAAAAHDFDIGVERLHAVYIRVLLSYRDYRTLHDSAILVVRNLTESVFADLTDRK